MRPYKERILAQTGEETKRELLGQIWHTGENIARAAERQDTSALDAHFHFLCEQMRRLDAIDRRIARENNGADHD